MGYFMHKRNHAHGLPVMSAFAPVPPFPTKLHSSTLLLINSKLERIKNNIFEISSKFDQYRGRMCHPGVTRIRIQQVQRIGILGSHKKSNEGLITGMSFLGRICKRHTEVKGVHGLFLYNLQKGGRGVTKNLKLREATYK